MSDKTLTKFAVASLVIIGLGIIGYKIYLLTPKFITYENKSLGFTVQIPSYWQGRYLAIDNGVNLVEFKYQPAKSEQQLIFALAKASVDEWQAISQDRLKKPTSRQLASIGNVVYYAYWLPNNPYSGSEARIYLALVRDITQVLNSFQPGQNNFIKPEVCIQVITPAKDPVTDEIREFPTPCDVPNGWEILRVN